MKRIFSTALIVITTVIFVTSSYVSPDTFLSVDGRKAIVGKTETKAADIDDAPLPFEIFPEEWTPRYLPEPSKDTPTHIIPKLTIIIDDIGYNRRIAYRFMELDKNITLSILPYGPHRKEIAEKAHAMGVEIMLHLPMEPREYPKITPGPGAIYVSTQPDSLAEIITEHIQQFNGIRGVNNHMGSKLTATPSQMYRVFHELKKRDLFFIDSLTSPQSTCEASARLLQLPFGRRDIFLDHFITEKSIRKQIRHAADMAVFQSEAIAIGHPHQLTYQVLRDMLPWLKQRVKIEPASKLVHTIG